MNVQLLDVGAQDLTSVWSVQTMCIREHVWLAVKMKFKIVQSEFLKFCNRFFKFLIFSFFFLQHLPN